MIVDWLAAHPGGETGNARRSERAGGLQHAHHPVAAYDNYIDTIVSKTYGITLNIGGGQGQGRVTDIVLFDPTLIQAL